MRLKSKLLSVLVPLMLVPLLGLAAAAYVQMRDQARAQAEQELETLLGQLQLYGRDLQATAVANLQLFANSGQIQAYLLDESEVNRFQLLQPSLLRLLASYQAAYPEYYEIRLLLPDGYEDTRSVRNARRNISDDESSSSLFQALRASGEEVLLRFDVNPDDDKFVLYAGKAISLIDPSQDPLAARPRLRGYLALTIDLEGLVRQITASQAGANGYLFAVDAQGVIRIHADQKRVGERFESEWFGRLKQDVDGISVATGHWDGAEVAFHGAPIAANLWLVSAQPLAEFHAVTRSLGQVVAGITLLALLVMVAVSYWFMKSVFIQPVQALRDATRQVREGNLLVELDVSSNDEIGDLARAFREMGEGLHASQEQIRFHAYHDNLTGLPNRFMFREHLEQAVGHARHYEETIGVLFADVDGFKRVNDTLGHHAGDDLLKQISERIRAVLRQQDFLAAPGDLDPGMNVVSRIGGDEFVVLVNQMSYAVEASKIAQRVIDAIAAPFRVAGQEVYLGISIGIALYPGDAETAEELLRHADMAMFHAKAAGKNNFQFYSSQMNAVAVNSLSLEASLHRAMERDELFMVYQPKIDLRSGRVVSLEALVRWDHPEQGLIPPATFIPIAEEVGLINSLGEWILRNVCKQIRDWQRSAAEDLVVAVNISGQQIANPRFGLLVQQILRETGVAGKCLEFEVTETSVMRMESYIDTVFSAVRELGISISLDDFGTGYSSLSHLRRFPIDYLKIDRSFVDEVLSNADDRAIVSAIIGMAQNLGLQVVAEGVETFEQAEFIRARGCDFAQGYYFARPMRAEDLLIHLAQAEPRAVGGADPGQGRSCAGPDACLQCGRGSDPQDDPLQN